MKYALWIVQLLLAAAFGMAGFFKLATPIEALAAQMAWVAEVPSWTPRVAGAAEVLGAVGLVLPAATRIKPTLTPLAAAGLALVMVLAAGLHLSLGQLGALAPNAVLGGLALFVAWGRWKKAPIEPRTRSRSGAPAEATA